MVKRAFKQHVPNNGHFESCINRFATFYNVVNHKVTSALLSLVAILILRRILLLKEMVSFGTIGRRNGDQEALEAVKTF